MLKSVGLSSFGYTMKAATAPTKRRMSHYVLNINIDKKSLQALRQAKMALYAFKGSHTPSDFVSTVWFREDSLYEKNKLSWKTKYDIYISATEKIDVGTTICSSTTRAMWAGGTAIINDDNTVTLDSAKGTPKFYSFLNKGIKPHTCGLSTPNPRGESVPICATILHGKNAAGMKPIEKVYLCFSNSMHPEGSVLMQTSSPGLVVDVKPSSMFDANVYFDMEKGWTCNKHESNCMPIEANEVFSKVLNSEENF